MSKRAISACTLAMALVLTSAAYAHEDERNNRRDSRYGVGDYGAEQGYRDGVDHGRSDRSRNTGYNYKSSDYQRGDRGYQKNMGSKGQYKQRYRDGYRQGYEDGYNGRGGFGGIFGRGRDDDRNRNGIPDARERDRRYPNDGEIWRDRRNGGVYGNGSEVARVAYDYGFQDGVYYAQRDRSRNHSANPTDAKGYKDADRGYNSRFNRDEFKRYYREGFIRGYNQEYGRR
jgi:hypothetical protein